MNEKVLSDYEHIRSGGAGFHELKRGLVAVWGKEAVQFLDGMITNDMKTLADGGEMLAAFPNAQGRLLAVVRVLRQGDRFLFETEEATREKVYNHLFRFTFAGDFFVEDLSEQYTYFEVFGRAEPYEGGLLFAAGRSAGLFIPAETAEEFRGNLENENAAHVSDEVFEVLRIESGIPKYGVDMDENTIIPELGLDGMISYTKGCYVGQEIIARIHFRGHVAKQLTGLISEPAATGFAAGTELTTHEGKNAGRITSVSYSPKLDKQIALTFVRYDHLAEGTALVADGVPVTVKNLPFME